MAYVSTTESIMQKASTINDATAANRVLLIFTLSKYTVSVYMIVSEEPMIIDAQRPAKLSGLTSDSIFCIIAVVPLPEIGRMIIIGKTSFGICNISVIGRRQVQRMSRAPLAENIWTATMRRTRLGKSLTQEENPLLAPDINAPEASLSDVIITIPAMQTKSGNDSSPINLIAFP